MSEPAPFYGIPRTESEKVGLLASRPGGWEYLLYAGVLLAERDRLEAKWRDEELELPGPTRTHLAEERAALDRAQAQLAHIQVTLRAFNRLFESEAQERAFGAPGEPGDPARIEHLAKRTMDIYEGLLDWAADLRGCAVPDDYETLFGLLPRMARGSIRAVHDFVDDVAREVAEIPALMELPKPEEPHRIELNVVLEIDPGVEDAVHKEFERLSSSR